MAGLNGVRMEAGGRVRSMAKRLNAERRALDTRDEKVMDQN